MAANLSGMFNQLNQAIGRSPVGAAQGLLDQTSRGFGGAMGAATGSDPYSFMNQGAKQLQGQQDLGREDLSSTSGLQKASEIYGKMGDVQNQLTAAQAAKTQKMAEEARVQKQKLRESLATRAEEAGLTGMAVGIRTGATDLGDDAKTIREHERMTMLSERGWPTQKALLVNSGFTEKEAQSFKTASPEQISAIIEGQEGKTASFLSSDGNPVSLRESKFGRIFDTTDGKWKDPSDMGLTPAPQVQKVHNLTNDLVKGYGDAAVEGYVDLFNEANDSVDMVNNVNRALGYLEDMPVGPGAGVSMFVRRLAMAVGDNPDAAVSNAEAYMAESGKRVAEIIKAFGSGTGLSDADREYAAKIAGGDISVTPAALRKLLNIQRNGAQGTIDYFKQVDAKGRERLGSEAGVMDHFVLKDVTPIESGALIFNPSTGQFE